MTTAPVSELATQVRGVTYRKADAAPEPRDATVGVVRAGNIQDGELNVSDLVYVPRNLVSEKQLLRAGDVLVATSSGSLDVVGKAARVRSDQSVAFGAFCKVLRPGPEVDPAYFAHYFMTPQYRAHASRVAAGANINNLKKAHLDSIEIPLPPRGEQRRIAEVLDAADKLRAQRREALAKLDNLTQAIFIDLFGDPNALGPEGGVRVDALFRDVSRGQVKTKQRDFLSTGTYPLVDQGRELIGGFTDDENVLANCDLPVVVFGDHTRAVKFVDFRFGVGAEGVKLLAPMDGIHPLYLYWVLRLLELPSAGYSRHFKFLRERYAAVPRWGIQLRFAQLVGAVEARRRAVRMAADLVDELHASLQQRAFRGEL